MKNSNIFFENLKPGNIFFRGNKYNSHYILNKIDILAEYLEKNVKKHSPFIYLYTYNHLNTAISYFSILKAGYACVIIDPEIKPIELDILKQDTPPAAVINFDPNITDIVFYKDIQINQTYINRNIELNNDVCTLVYTAAEDGVPKAAMLTYNNLFSNTKAIIESNNVLRDSISCSVIPFYHLFGLQTGVLVPFLNNSDSYISELHNPKYIEILIEDLKNINVTHFYSVPLLFYLLKRIKYFNKLFSNNTTFWSGGYKLPSSIYEYYLTNFNIDIHEGYGLTEASPVCSLHHYNDKVNIDSIGRALNCCEIKIFDENNTDLSIGEIGEICVKGNNVMKGYYNKDLTNKSTIINGWLHTGDMGYINNDGLVFITGLKKKMYNVAGKNVYPEELINLIKMNESVSDVELISNYNELVGHRLNAKIRLKKNYNINSMDLKKWCKENISYYKIPSVFEIIN